MKIAVIGTGYVGLVTGTCFAETGNHVICVDIDSEKVEKLRSGVIPIYEPHLDALFERNIKQGRLTFTTNLSEAIKDSTIVFLALQLIPGDPAIIMLGEYATPEQITNLRTQLGLDRPIYIQYLSFLNYMMI